MWQQGGPWKYIDSDTDTTPLQNYKAICDSFQLLSNSCSSKWFQFSYSFIFAHKEMYTLAGSSWTEENLGGMHTQIGVRLNWISKQQRENENVA